MAIDLKGRSLPNLLDYTEQEILYLIDLAVTLKSKRKKGFFDNVLANRNIALIFEKPSTRTRCAFTVAANDLGARTEYLAKGDIQLGHKESVEDTARVLGRMFDAIEFRGFSQEHVEKLIQYSGVPVFNGLTDLYHPTQALADMMTAKECFGNPQNLTMAFVGDGRNNVANSLMIIASKLGTDYRCAAPKSLWPDEALVKKCKRFAKESGGKVLITEDIQKAVDQSDIVYTDVWCSMGEEDKAKERITLLSPYQVNEKLMAGTHKESIALHCLPAVKGNEITEETFEKHAQVIFDQAENRMHTIKSVLLATMRH